VTLKRKGGGKRKDTVFLFPSFLEFPAGRYLLYHTAFQAPGVRNRPDSLLSQ